MTDGPSSAWSARAFAVPAAIGAVCTLFLVLGGFLLGAIMPEWVGQLVWLVVVLGGSAICGFRAPVHAWRWGAVIVGVQPVCVFILLAVVGEITRPTSSTGGLVAVFIFSTFMVFVAPVAMLASFLGGWLRSRRQSGQGAAT